MLFHLGLQQMGLYCKYQQYNGLYTPPPLQLPSRCLLQLNKPLTYSCIFRILLLLDFTFR